MADFVKLEGEKDAKGNQLYEAVVVKETRTPLTLRDKEWELKALQELKAKLQAKLADEITSIDAKISAVQSEIDKLKTL